MTEITISSRISFPREPSPQLEGLAQAFLSGMAPGIFQ